MCIARKATIAASKVMAAAGLDLLTQPDLIKAAQEDFEKQKKGKTYKSLNELDAPAVVETPTKKPNKKTEDTN